MARLVDARAPLLPLGHHAGLSFCNAYGDWRRAMVLMEDMRVARRRPSGEKRPPVGRAVVVSGSVGVRAKTSNEPEGLVCLFCCPRCCVGTVTSELLRFPSPVELRVVSFFRVIHPSKPSRARRVRRRTVVYCVVRPQIRRTEELITPPDRPVIGT